MAKSRVAITLCQHGKFPATLLLKFFVLYYKRNIKLFSVLIYSYINTRENWKNSKLSENTPPCGRRVSTQFLVFPISTRVDITVYQHGKCFIFLNYYIPVLCICLVLLLITFLCYNPKYSYQFIFIYINKSACVVERNCYFSKVDINIKVMICTENRANQSWKLPLENRITIYKRILMSMI